MICLWLGFGHIYCDLGNRCGQNPVISIEICTNQEFAQRKIFPCRFPIKFKLVKWIHDFNTRKLCLKVASVYTIDNGLFARKIPPKCDHTFTLKFANTKNNNIKPVIPHQNVSYIYIWRSRSDNFFLFTQTGLTPVNKCDTFFLLLSFILSMKSM